MTSTNDALEHLTRAAMCTGAVYFAEQAKLGRVQPNRPLSDAFGIEPQEFLKTRRDLVEPFIPRILDGVRTDITAALDALPLGTAVAWSDAAGRCVALKERTRAGDLVWFEAGYARPQTSEHLARHGVRIEVLA